MTVQDAPLGPQTSVDGALAWAQALLASVPAPLALVDADGRLLGANEELATLCGVRPAEAVGCLLDDLRPELGRALAILEDGEPGAGIGSVDVTLSAGAGETGAAQERRFRASLRPLEAAASFPLFLGCSVLSLLPTDGNTHALAGGLVVGDGEAGAQVSGLDEEALSRIPAWRNEAVWCVELRPPLEITRGGRPRPIDEMIDEAFTGAVLAHCNALFARMYGYERPEELLGVGLDVLLPLEDPANREYLRAFMANGFRLLSGETVEVDREGRARYFVNNLSGEVVDGRLLRVWGAQRDISEQRQAQIERQEADQRLHQLAESLDSVFYIVDLEKGKTQYVSPSFQSVFGRDLSESEGAFARLSEWAYPEDREIVARLGEARARGEGAAAEYRIVRPDGQVRWIEDSVFALYEPDRAARRLSGIARDITERKRQEEATRHTQQFLQSALDALSASISILSAEGEIIAVNRAWRSFAPWSSFWGPEGGLGQNYLRACEDERGILSREGPALARGIRDVLSGRVREFYLEYAAQTLQGQRWYSVRATRFLDPADPNAPADQSARRAVMVHEDITARRRVEAALREETSALEAVNRTGQVLAAELDVQKLAQAVVEAASDLAGARSGAFLAHPQLARPHALSGAPQIPDAFAGTARASSDTDATPGAEGSEGRQGGRWNREAEVLAPIWRGEGVFRTADARQVPGWESGDLWRDTPFAQAEVASFLAVPVTSRSGQVLGGLFFADPEPESFSERVVRIVEGLAALASVALDNALLFEAVRRERAGFEESERRYRFLSERIAQIVWTTHADGFHDYFNQRWYDYTGADPSDSLGHQWTSHLHPNDQERASRRWAQSLATGEPYEIEYRFRRHDGQYRWFLGLALPLRDEEGRVVKWFGTCTDIDDQKQAEDVLRLMADAGEILSASLDDRHNLGELARRMVPTMGDWCCVDIVNEKGGLEALAVVHVDPPKEAVLRRIQRKALAPPANMGLNRIVREARSLLWPRINEAARREVSVDTEHFDDLGQVGFASTMSVPLVSRGRVMGVLTLSSGAGRVYDEADLFLAEELARRAAQSMDNSRLYQEAQSALASAEEAGRAKDDFLATVSHELRTPLTSILGWASLLKDGHVDEPTMARALSTIERSVKSQAQIVEDLLDVSRIVAGKLRLEMRPLDIEPIVQSAIETVRPAMTAKSIDFDLVLPPVGKVSGDPTRLQQIVWNLLSNAVKFAPREGRVALSVSQSGAHLELRVSDSGPGISPEFVPYIFERFRQADSTSTRKHGGLGLGLAIVRHLVEMHGGRVWVDPPVPGQGASFGVELPLLAEAPAADEASEPKDNAESAHLLRGLRVLVVEDEPDARDLFAAVLSRFGAQVQTAPSAASGFEALRSWQPHALVSDIGMPGEDGHSLIRRVRALGGDYAQIPAVALTAYARDEDREKALAAGFDVHLAKPMSPIDLALTVAGLVERRSHKNSPQE
jgi:PAS domain S-box-containing protein